MRNDHMIRRAYERPEFLNSAEGRSVRILSEYLEPESRLNKLRIWHTIAFFGSARLVDEERARERLASLERSGATEQELQSARLLLEMSHYYEDARRLARMVTEWSLTLPLDEQLVVSSGGGGGIMEAANRGAQEAGGRTIALNIQLPFEQRANPWVQEELTFDFHYFFMRKFWFVYRAKVIVVFPGGFGTLDELMESLALTQTGRVEKKMVIIIYGKKFWSEVLHLEALARWGTIDPHDLSLFHYADTPEEALDYVRNCLSFNLPNGQ